MNARKVSSEARGRRKKKKKFKILLVDDQLEGARSLIDAERFKPTLRLPSKVDENGEFEPLAEGDVRSADIILMDYQLGPGVGNFLDEYRDGKAYAAAIRHYFRDKKRKSPCTIILYSGEIRKLVGNNVTVKGREHVIARQNEFDWVIAKGRGISLNKAKEGVNFSLESIAGAMARLSPFVGKNARPATFDTRLRSFLGMPDDAEWRDSAWEEIKECDPPYSDFSASGDAMVFLRWLLHVILPFPSFLLDRQSVAIRLGISPKSLQSALNTKPNSGLSKKLKEISYLGALDDFLGTQWWRAGVNNLVWHVAEGNLFDRKRIHGQLTKLAGVKLEPLDVNDPVRLVDQDFILTDEISESLDAVQIQPSDWPDVIERPWIATKVAEREPKIREIVIPEHEGRLRKK